MNTVEFGSICRLCMSSKGMMMDIFQSDELEDDADYSSRPIPLDLRIMSCSSVKVARDDGLPSQACKECLLMLDRWFRFKEKIETTDATLRKLVYGDYEDVTNIHEACDETKMQGSFPSSRVNSVARFQHIKTITPSAYVTQPLKIVNIVRTRLHVEANGSYCNDDSQNPDEEAFDNDSEEIEMQNNTSHKYRPTESSEMPVVGKSAPKPSARKKSPGKPHGCATCGKFFSQTGDLHIHMRIHSGERPYVCDVCGKSFPSSSNLARHKRTHTGARPFLCSLCPKTFAVQSALREHENVHSGNKPFLCQECGKSFAQKGNLKIHEMLHTGAKPYACDVCDKSFALRGNLKDHLNIHSRRRPFACDVCAKSFTQRSTLREHLKVHSGAKPYACTACQKTFAYRKTLKIHLNTHTGEKPYVCQVCNKRFSERSHLKRHVNIHTNSQSTDEEVLPT